MGNSSPLVAVTVPVYDQKREYIDECIASVKGQTYSDWRLYIVDDGSSEDNAAYLDEIARSDDRISVVHQKNSGPSAARNKGIELAKDAEYITFLDSDDLLEPDMIRRCLDEAKKTSADIVACTHSRFSAGDKRPDDYEGPGNIIFDKSSLTDFLRICFCSRGTGDIYFPFCVCTWGKLFRMDLFRENPDIRFDTRLHYSEDQKFLQEMVPRAGRIALIHEDLYAYRANDDSLIRSLRKDFLESNMHAFDALSEVVDKDNAALMEAFDNYRAGYLVGYGTFVLYHPTAEYKAGERRRLLREAAQLSHFRNTLDKIRPQFFTRGQYIYLRLIRSGLYGPALLAARYGARQKWKK